MFSNLTVGIILGIGFGGWVYSKLNRSTGGNAKNALVGAVVCGAIACLIMTTLMAMITSN